MDIANVILRIGDYVTFKNIKHSSLLSAEGILREDLAVDDQVRVLDDCLFCIHLQRQYSASRELEEFLASGSSTDDVNSIKYLQALKRGSANENKLNDNYLKQKMGQVVLFGDTIQLFHVKSGKYLKVLPGKLAKDERENTMITLDTIGSIYSWIQICPRYKIDREGEKIRSKSEVYLKVSERANEYIHRSDREPLPGHEREANCSLEATSWRLNIFQSSTDSANSSLMLASQLVYISDPETRCSLTIHLPGLDVLDGDIIDITKTQRKLNRVNSMFSTAGITGDDNQNMERDEDYIEEVDEEEAEGVIDEPQDRNFAHDFGDIILEPYQDYISSNSLWFIERQSILNGGPMKLKTDKIRLKHMNTGLYLMCAIYEDDNNLMEDMIFTTASKPNMPGTLFTVNEATGTSKFIVNGKALQMGHQGVWIERGDVLDNGNFIVKGTKDKLTALNLIIKRYSSSTAFDTEEDKANESADSDVSREPLDVYVGLSGRNYLRKYYNMTIVPRNDSVSTLWPTATRSDMEFFEFLARRFVYFSQGFPISSDNIQLGIDKAEANLRIQRQNLFREQNTLEVVIRMINRLVPISDRLDQIKNAPAKKRQIISESEQSMLNMGQKLLGVCFNLLYYCILDNPDNQMYVADHMPVLLAHLNTQPLAGKCVTEMLSKNLELQETKIGTREIQIFVDKLRGSKMNAMYLQLLQSCCSCEGDGVDANQCKVATMLFSDTNDVIINLHADYSHNKIVDWNQPNLYIPIAPVPGSPLRGDNLVTKGLPQLSLAWTTNSIDFSPLGLFGKLSVKVEDLFRRLDAGELAALKKVKSSKKKSSSDQKEAVANYFIAEMFLGAEMCMDRNYVAMHKLDPLFSYEVLLTMLKLDVSDSLKGAAVRLLMCLHIDRDPQAVSKIPRLTRTWSDIERNPTPQLPCVEPGRKYTFGIIQQLVSEHVKSMANKRWDDVSRHMLKMLRTLAEFNFYGTNERVNDLIGPLIAAVDRRNVINSTEDLANDELNDANQDSSLSKDNSFSDIQDLKNVEEIDEKEEKTDNSQNSRNISSFYVTLKYFASSLYNLVSFSEAIAIDFSDKNETNSVEKFQNPPRYSKAPIYELETMVEAVDILAFAQRVIEDRNLSLLLRYFYDWEKGEDNRTPAEIFEQVVADSKQLTLDIADFDNVMIDVLMFVHMPLVQSTLEVLMAHHSLRQTLLDNANSVQLLQSHSRERQYKIVDQMLQQLEQNAETHELWGELENDAHHAVNKQTKDTLKELTDICKIRRVVLEFDEDYMADSDIQDLYRNLGCFDICMKIMGLLDSVEEDENGELSEVAANTRDLCLLCNTLLYWFFLGNAKNQELGYGELDFFLDTLDAEIKSHLVIGAIFKNNEVLMKQVPHSHLASLVDMIIKNGKSHHYLSLFASISHAGDKNIVENQFEIVKSLTSPGRLQKVACFFVPIDHPDYEEKRQLMEPFLNNTNDLSLDDLPPLLAYHLMFLEVLSGCTVGRMNVTTVEAKVQSVFNYIDIVESIIDPGTIIVTKIRLCKFFYNSIIEVELKIPGLDQASIIWNLLESFKPILNSAKETIMKCEKLGWNHPQISRQAIEYIIVCIMVIGGFFQHYYNPATFQHDDRDNSMSHAKATKVNFSLSHVDELILFFFTKIKEIHELSSSILSNEIKKVIYSALETLNKKVSGDHKIQGILKPLKSAIPGQTSNLNEEDEEALELTDDDPEKKMISTYKDFLSNIQGDQDIHYKTVNENVAFISILEKLPFIADPVVSDVRYETLIKKLVYHIRENIKIVNNQKRLDVRVTKTSTWIIRAFRTMIENRMGMSIYERDDEGGADQDEAAAPVVNALNSCGATALCLDLIADGIDEGLQLEAIKLGVGLLFKEGGALEVQGIMYNHLMKTQSSLFFKQVRLTLQKLQAWHSWNGVVLLEDGEEPKPLDEILIVRFLQLMCEGHYLPNQDIMREQPNNPVSYNLLDDFVSYLNCLSRLPCRTSTTAGIRLSATILEVIQGPCEGNQAHFALATELIEALNRLNRAKLINDCIEEEEIELKKTSIDIFQGLLEGQGEKSVVYERVLSVIHLDIIQMMSKGSLMKTDDSKSSIPDELREEHEILKTECIVLLQMLCNFKPSLYDELGISRNIEDIVGSGTAMIEVIWRGDIHRRFFHVPNICEYLSKLSKDNLVAEVDRSNSEKKLVDFLARSHELYREVKHQQLLTDLGISGLFSRKVQDRATWITFILAVVINILLMAYYTGSYSSDRVATIPNNIAYVIQILNGIQIGIAAGVLILWLVVHIPIKYQTLQAENLSNLKLILYTASDSMTMYYTGYLVLNLLGQFVTYDVMPFLLLDIIVKNSTTRDVLNAVIFPRRQLAMGTVIILFLVQIYAFFLFLYFRNKLSGHQHYCETLFGCYKVALGYGLRQGGGAGDIFNASIGTRWWLDISFYFVIDVIMMNLVAGVIITTFGQLRENQLIKKMDTEGVCFICGIGKQIFDRASDEPDGFKTHVKVDHNMWNYLYFIFLLWEQDKDDDDGMEQYVRRAIDAEEIAWFPINKAIRLDQAASAEEALINGLKRSVNKSEQGIANKLDKFQTQINVVLEQLNQALKQDQHQDRDLSVRKSSIINGTSNHRKSSFFQNLKNATRNSDELLKDNKDKYEIELLEVSGSSIIKLMQDCDSIICNSSYGMDFDKFLCHFQTSSLKLKDAIIKIIADEDIPFLMIQFSQESVNPYHLSELANLKLLVTDITIAEQSRYETFFKSNSGDILKISMYVRKI